MKRYTLLYCHNILARAHEMVLRIKDNKCDIVILNQTFSYCKKLNISKIKILKHYDYQRIKKKHI